MQAGVAAPVQAFHNLPKNRRSPVEEGKHLLRFFNQPVRHTGPPSSLDRIPHKVAGFLGRASDGVQEDHDGRGLRHLGRTFCVIYGDCSSILEDQHLPGVLVSSQAGLVVGLLGDEEAAVCPSISCP